VRFSKINAIAVALVCLYLAVPAQGQFGHLKDLAKGKLTSKSNETQDKAVASAGDSASHKGIAGECKASFAPGVSKKSASVAVTRKGGATPEARVSAPQQGGTSQVLVGSPQVVALKVSGVDARQFELVRSYGACRKLSAFTILSATQLKVTVDLTEAKSNGSCTLYFRSGQDTLFSADVAYKVKK